VSPKLSYILPVFNGERCLRNHVHRLLDILSDLTSEFEILILDDGSHDDTFNIATELSQAFPQVFCLRNQLEYGQQASEQSGLRATHGELVLIQERSTVPTVKEIVQLWELRHDPHLVVAVGRSSSLNVSDTTRHLRLDGGVGGIPRQGATPITSGLKIIRREAIRKLGTGKLPKHHLKVKRIKV